MKTLAHQTVRLLITAVAVFAPALCTQAGNFSSDFNSGLPANTAVFGSAFVDTIDGVGGSGCLKLTDTGGSEIGVLIITNDLDAGSSVLSFSASFKMTIGGGTGGGDGFSFNFANNLDLTGNWVNAEEGNGTGLTIEFDTYQNSAGEAPNIDVKVGGVEVATSSAPQLMTSTGNYVDVLVQLNPDKTLTVIYDGIYAYSNLDLSASLTGPIYPFTGALFGIGGRNGGSTANKFLDNLTIVTRTNSTAFVRSISPGGRLVQPSATIDITLTNSGTAVNGGSIALQLDGATVTPTISTGSGTTSIHYAPPKPFGPYTTHTVSLTFSDNASPTPNANSLQYSFSLPASSFVTLFADGFEGYTAGGNPLDMNTAGPNASANGNLAGNPWFGPAPPNLRVVTTEAGVVPHGGVKMTRGSAPSDFDEEWYNLMYRLNGGNYYTGNIMMDWYFYDPLGSGGSSYQDFGALGYYNLAPNNIDYPGTGSLNGSGQIQRLSLGASSVQTAGLFDATKYQARMVGADDGYASGWFNTKTARTVGWHHARVAVGPTLDNGVNYAFYYIDDMTNPTFMHVDRLAYGYNVLELNQNYGSTTGYMDDVSFAVGRPPNPTVALSGNEAVVTWPGLDFTLQSASVATGPYTDVTGAVSGYMYDVTTGPKLFFRLRQM